MVRARPDEEMSCLDLAQADALVDLGERMGTGIASWQGPRSLRIQQFVGMVRPAAFDFEILPKLDGLPEPATVRQSLLGMLAVTQDLDVQASEIVRSWKARNLSSARWPASTAVGSWRRSVGGCGRSMSFARTSSLMSEEKSGRPSRPGCRPLTAWKSPVSLTSGRRIRLSTGPSRPPFSQRGECWNQPGPPVRSPNCATPWTGSPTIARRRICELGCAPTA